MKYLGDDYFISSLEGGEKLYHYTSAAGLKGICEGEFWVTEQHFLNDSSESTVATEVFLKTIEERIADKRIYDKIENELCEELRRESPMASGNYVISFCLDEDSILLWSEYSNFMGYCMRFDYQQFHSNFSKYECLHGRVIYDEVEQKRAILKTIEKWLAEGISDRHTINDYFSSLKPDETADFVNWASVICEAYNIFFKRKCFKGENEYRYVISCRNNKAPTNPKIEKEQYFRLKDEVFIPYIKKQIEDLQCLESVTVGPNNKIDIAVEGLKAFFKYQGLNVEVKRSEVPLRY